MEESGEMRTADAKTLSKISDSLAKQRDSAANVVVTLPSCCCNLASPKDGSDKAPDFDKAVAAFQQARSIMENARRYGRNLASSTTTTNVNLAEDFGKVEKHWVEQVRNFTSTIDETIKVIKGQIEEWIDDDDKVVESSPRRRLSF